ncbi:MAG: phosphate ABC transporter substrate-binding protein [Chitinispirillaceae bacterium]|nr:phosphate ABC transporter substrate-binding protein [Chitinispirillaceae bacterium]
MKKRILNQIRVIAVALAGIMLFVAAAKKTITIKGSDTLVILAQRWAEKYMASHSDVVIQVTGGGSGVGISALINGTTDFANASREMKKSEIDKLKQRYNTLGNEIKVAKDGITLYANAANAVDELSLAQIKAIYLAEITNWRDVGGDDAPIVLYGRENSSGTYVYFRDNVLDGNDYSATMQSLPGTAAVVNAVVKDKNGIGYGGAAYAEGIKVIKVKKDASSPGYAPTAASVKSNQYPIARYLYMYSRSKPTGAMKAYVDWILGPEGQELVTKVGYFPVK